ncbi:MAG: branched-chain amino acid ABC transporter substrate-binding protein [Hyphomicrobiaceae bacterium]
MKKLVLGSLLALGLAGPAFAADITIATIGPMTGQYASFGQQMKAGAEQAVADINAAGGVNGKQIKLLVEDDACDPKQAVAAAGKLSAAKVALVAGHFCSGSSIPASKVYAEEGIVQISPASTNPKLTDERAGPNVFRVCGRDDQQGEVAGSYLAKNFAGKKIAILHDKTAYGKGLADETRKYMNKAGLKDTMYEAYTAGEKDYTALVSKMKQAGIDVAYVGGYHTEAGLIVRQMRDQGMKTQLMSGDALVTQEYWQVTGKAGEGTLMTFSPDPRKSPAAKDIVAKFRAKNIEPEGYVLYTYAAIQAWAQAASSAKTEAADKVIGKLNGTEFSTVLGKFKFDKKGDPNLPPYKFYEWKSGKYDQIN